MADRLEIILRWAYSELTSTRFSNDMAGAGVSADLIELAQTHSYDEVFQPGRLLNLDFASQLLHAIYKLRSGNITMLFAEEYQIQDWAKNDVLNLRVVPANGNLPIKQYMNIEPSNHEYDPRRMVTLMTEDELRVLPNTPGIIGWNGQNFVLLDGTLRTLARLRRDDTTFPMWTPVSLFRSV